MKHLRDWFLELDPSDDVGDPNYFSSNPSYSSEIYARTDDGQVAQVASIPLVLTDADHERIREIERERDEAISNYFVRHNKAHNNKRHWWSLKPQHIYDGEDNSEEWHDTLSKHDTTELVYKPRHSHELYEAHLHLVLSSPYMYDLLAKYRDTGTIDPTEVTKVLNIADGIDTPHITQVPKWKQRLSVDAPKN